MFAPGFVQSAGITLRTAAVCAANIDGADTRR
jgi:hypothetical protein